MKCPSCGTQIHRYGPCILNDRPPSVFLGAFRCMRCQSMFSAGIYDPDLDAAAAGVWARTGRAIIGAFDRGIEYADAMNRAGAWQREAPAGCRT